VYLSSAQQALANKRALITGAGRGIGRAIALGYAAAGADVCALARTESELEAVCSEIRGLGRRAVHVVADVQRREDVARIGPAVTTALGGLDILVNCADR
jgi:NAD(P)-dependent dehydrogenase (short-subunit alcohol dehydrogenase family)